MTRYVPGQQIKDFIKDIQPPSEYDADFEYGFFNGDYAVSSEPPTLSRPELEKIRTAAVTQWQNRVATFPEIIHWQKNGAKDPLTEEFTMEVPAGDEQRKTVLLIENEVFVRIW
ncbi:MAG: hypothetical protein F4227_02255 [Gammaproteobacteria bacterium]|nr:hypothetical protein [Gammaproteobacteria bacterium]MYF01822.1 hypothetical protein [Gammaproteobacteria bacterium]